MRHLLILLFAIPFPSTGTGQDTSLSGIQIFEVLGATAKITNRNPKECRYCYDVKKEMLNNIPLISDKDIIYFDWDLQKIVLTKEMQAKIDSIDISLYGHPLAMTLNGEIIYSFWFWNTDSSYGCDRVYAYPTQDFIIDFGLPSNYAFGEDPRFDTKLENYVRQYKMKR